MPLFEDEKWVVVPQMVEGVRRGESVSHVGYIVSAVHEDGTEIPLVDDHGIGSAPRDLLAARLFAASKDLFNAVEALRPALSTLNLTPSEEEALAMIDAALVAVRDETAEPARDGRTAP